MSEQASSKPLSLNDIAPYPKTAKGVTAEAMAKHYAAFTQLHHRVAMDHPDRDEAKKSIGMVVAYYGITYLLRELQKRAGYRVADDIARILWQDWNDGSGLGAEIWEWLVVEYGVDPEKVNAIAAGLIASSKPSAADEPGQVEPAPAAGDKVRLADLTDRIEDETPLYVIHPDWNGGNPVRLREVALWGDDIPFGDIGVRYSYVGGDGDDRHRSDCVSAATLVAPYGGAE